jgi:heterodisulfide reductase subunit A
MKNKKIGVYICQCGSNISDVVDVEKVRDAVAGIPGVHIAQVIMFACADSAQKDMIRDIREQELEGLVVASCSPKLHVPTFRNVAKRAGLNPYQYVQVNIREQSSWAHSDQHEKATEKALRLIKAGITKVQFARDLNPIEINAVNAVAVIGAGVAGMRAAAGLAALGTRVYLLERDHSVGGRVAQWGRLTGSDTTGKELVERLYRELSGYDNIELFTGIVCESITGSVGNFSLNFTGKPGQERGGAAPGQDSEGAGAVKAAEKHQVQVGAVILATGFDPYTPQEGEFGYGTHPAVLTLDEFVSTLGAEGSLPAPDNRPVRQIAFIYCVGSCQVDGQNKYCSRICCTTALDASVRLKKSYPEIHFLHLYRHIRTYGKYELIYEEACRNGDIFIKFNDDEPPEVSMENGQISVKVTDQLTLGKELEIRPDLLVLVTGMVPASGYEKTAELFKAPLGRDKFFNEVHPKLRPVETVIDGIFIAGAGQGPKNIPESVKSALSAVSKAHALLNEEKIELDPTIARIDPAKCNWCNLCSDICPFDAIRMEKHDGKEIAAVLSASCKGCGMCNPVCPTDAIDLIGYTNDEVEGMIDSLIAAEQTHG